MKIYDTHSDVFSNLYERHINNEKNIFEKYHYQNLRIGEVAGGIWVVYSSSFFDIERAYEIALKEFEPYKDKFDVVYGLEGLKNVKSLASFNHLYDLGVRHAMLTWNEENDFATGVKGDPNHGLKDMGKQVLDFMMENHMIIDVSHLNQKSFYDVINYVNGPVIASHSNAYSISNHPRNLTDDQLKELKRTKSYVGVNSARNFVSKDYRCQNVQGLVDQIKYLVNALDINHVMLGLDMMDYLGDYGNNDNLDDLTSHADAQNIIECLALNGFSNEDIEKIAYKNFLNMRKELIGE